MAEERVVSVRLDTDKADLVDKAAAEKGLTRTEWLRRVIDRGLQGAGLVEAPVTRPETPTGRPAEVESRLKVKGRVGKRQIGVRR